MDLHIEPWVPGATWPVYGLLVVLYVVKGVSRTFEGQDVLLVLGLAVCGLARAGDPLMGFGLDMRHLVSGPHVKWEVSALGLVALSRVITGPLLGRRLAPLIASGRLSPGGAHAACKGRALPEALAVGTAFIGLATLFEEVVFRGLVQQGLHRAAATLGLNEAVAAAAAVFGSASAFALVHWLPMRLARVDPMVTAMSWALPFTAGLVLGWLAIESGSLWGPWTVHSAVNVTALGAAMIRSSGTAGEIRGDRNDGRFARTHTAKPGRG